MNFNYIVVSGFEFYTSLKNNNSNKEYLLGQKYMISAVTFPTTYAPTAEQGLQKLKSLRNFPPIVSELRESLAWDVTMIIQDSLINNTEQQLHVTRVLLLMDNFYQLQFYSAALRYYVMSARFSLMTRLNWKTFFSKKFSCETSILTPTRHRSSLQSVAAKQRNIFS